MISRNAILVIICFWAVMLLASIGYLIFLTHLTMTCKASITFNQEQTQENISEMLPTLSSAPKGSKK